MSAVDRNPADFAAAAAQRWFDELSDRGIFTTDTSLTIRTWNPWLEAQTGLAARVVVGRALFDVWPTIRERGLDQYYREALSGEVRVLSERFHKDLIPISRGTRRQRAGAPEPDSRLRARATDGRRCVEIEGRVSRDAVT
jgi:PAS domain S-box-containing protein